MDRDARVTWQDDRAVPRDANHREQDHATGAVRALISAGLVEKAAAHEAVADDAATIRAASMTLSEARVLPRLPFSGPDVGEALAAEADRRPLPAPLALAAGDDTAPDR